MKMQNVIARGGNHFLVSTVLLPYGWSGEEYETMVFSCDAGGVVDNWGDLYCARYGSPDEAAAGHDRTVASWNP